MGSFFKLFKRFRWLDYIFIVFILGLTFLQVYCTMSMTDSMENLILAIQRVDLGVPGYSVSDIWRHGGLMFLFAASGVAAQIVVGIFAAKITSRFIAIVRKDFYEKVSSFSLAEINSFSTASLVTRSTNDVEQVMFALLFGLRMFFSAPITAIWAILKINAASGKLTWVIAGGILFIVVVLSVVIIFLFPKFKLSQAYIDRLNAVTRESILGVRVVRAYNAEDYQEEKFEKANKNLTKLNLFTARMIGLFNPVIVLVLDGVTLGIYYIGARLMKSGEISYSTVVAFASLAVQVVMAFMMLLMLLVMFPRAMVSAKRIDEVLGTKSSIVDPSSPKVMQRKGALSFKNVSFAYNEAGGNILKELTFEIDPGKTLAIVGATGSGKTTLVNLISRLYDASEGEVLVGDINVKELSLLDLRGDIGVVPQKGMLFSGTVRSNVMLGIDDENDDALLKEALEVSCADSFVHEMEGGVDAKIASGGTNVSGGQRQRLCIARAIATHPDILVFDDSFSALDFKTDRQVRQNIAKTFPNATKVIVAQRVGTIMDADLILVLDQGRIVGQGKHRQLLESCPIYREIALSQLSKEELGL